MGVVKVEDVIGWEFRSGAINCVDCGDDGDEEPRPITEEEYDSSEFIVTCDRCGKRIT